MTRRVTILGGHGFMGRWLVAHLQEAGCLVSAPRRAEVDVADIDSLRGEIRRHRPDAIINLAGISSVVHEDVAALYETNTLGHLRLLQAVAELAPMSRVFLASTANVYGKGATGQAFRETDNPAPRNHYAVSKLAAELVQAQFPDICAVSVARPFNGIGRGQAQTFLVAKLVDAYKRRVEVIELGNVDVRRDFVDVRDLCYMWEALITADSPPPVVNFGNAEAVALVDILATLARLSGHHVRVEVAPRLVRAADLTYQCADNSVISALGYKRRHSLEDTLAWMLADEEKHEQA